MGYKVAVVGATGNVGREMLNILAEREFPADEVVALASRRSLGAEVGFGERTLKARDLAQYDFAGTDIALFAAGSAVARLDGPRWRHEVDAPAAALLAGCRGQLPLRELLELLSFAHDRPVDALVAATLPAVRELVRHGLLVPAG